MNLSCCDAFCGMGGWSIGFHREGFRCFGFDIVDVGYPYDLLVRDIRNITADDLHRQNSGEKPTVFVSSPPCVEFSKISNLSYRKGQRAKPDPEKGMVLVRETKRLIDELHPRYWLLENVVTSRPYIEPFLGKPRLVANPWILWGNFPHGLFEQEPRRHSEQFHQLNAWTRTKGGSRRGLPEDFPFDPLRSWKRARVPVWLGQSIAQSIKTVLSQ